MKKITIAVTLVLALSLTLFGCTSGTRTQIPAPDSASGSTAEVNVNTASGTVKTGVEDAAETDDKDDEISPSVSPGKTISADGEYTLAGTIDGQVLVTAENVTLILDGVTIKCADGPGILGAYDNGKQNLTIELRGENSVTGGVKHGIQGKDNLTITGSGSVNITAEKDGIHAGDIMTIAGGTVNVLKSYEGIEAPSIIISGGNTTVHASDDGVNAATDKTDVMPSVKITGGTLTIYSGSDGIDSNGTIDITDGTVAVFINAPRDGDPLDIDRTASILPTLFAINTQISAGTKIEVDGIWNGTAEAAATSFSLTVPGLQDSQSYTIEANGASLFTGTATTTVQSMMMGGGGKGGGMGGGTGDLGGNRPRR